MNLRIKGALASLAIAGIVAAVAIAQSPPISPYDQWADVNGDGAVNIADRAIVALNSNTGATWPVNPCVPLEYWDDAHPWPTERGAAVNSLGEPYTPRGWSYGVPGEHPGYAALASGSPWPLRACVATP